MTSARMARRRSLRTGGSIRGAARSDGFTKSTPRVHRPSGMLRASVSTTEIPSASEALINRELSALDLMRRVLDLASDPAEPLLERVKFCGIVSVILDEFFMVRVAGLYDQVLAGLAVRLPDGRTPQQTLEEIRKRVLELSAAQSLLWRDDLCPALAAEGIRIGTVDDASEEELAELERVFAREIYPVLTPLAVGPGQPFPYISGLSLSLGVLVRDDAVGRGALCPREGARRACRGSCRSGRGACGSRSKRSSATSWVRSSPRWRCSSASRSG